MYPWSDPWSNYSCSWDKIPKIPVWMPFTFYSFSIYQGTIACLSNWRLFSRMRWYVWCLKCIMKQKLNATIFVSSSAQIALLLPPQVVYFSRIFNYLDLNSTRKFTQKSIWIFAPKIVKMKTDFFSIFCGKFNFAYLAKNQ